MRTSSRPTLNLLLLLLRASVQTFTMSVLSRFDLGSSAWFSLTLLPGSVRGGRTNTSERTSLPNFDTIEGEVGGTAARPHVVGHCRLTL